MVVGPYNKKEDGQKKSQMSIPYCNCLCPLNSYVGMVSALLKIIFDCHTIRMLDAVHLGKTEK